MILSSYVDLYWIVYQNAITFRGKNEGIMRQHNKLYSKGFFTLGYLVLFSFVLLGALFIRFSQKPEILAQAQSWISQIYNSHGLSYMGNSLAALPASNKIYIPLILDQGSAVPQTTPNPLITPTPQTTPNPLITPIPQVTQIPHNIDPVINAVGDIAACDAPLANQFGFHQTAALLQHLPGPILGLGDYVYFNGNPAFYTNCFDPVWGQFKSRIFPSVGNHEYLTPHATGYYGYFGAAAGDPTKGYYSYDIGSWHIVALNTNCSNAGALNGCFAGSPQEQWLRADLAAHPNLCTLAYWHHPLFSSGKEGNFWRAHDLYQVLVDNHVDLILNGHDHSYERFAPQDANGKSDPVNGIPEIIVGTGGKDHSPLIKRLPNSLVFDNTSFGILSVVLHPDGYDFQFIPVAGSTFTDSGSGKCH